LRHWPPSAGRQRFASASRYSPVILIPANRRLGSGRPERSSRVAWPLSSLPSCRSMASKRRFNGISLSRVFVLDVTFSASRAPHFFHALRGAARTVFVCSAQSFARCARARVSTNLDNLTRRKGHPTYIENGLDSKVFSSSRNPKRALISPGKTFCSAKMIVSRLNEIASRRNRSEEPKCQ